MNLNLLAKLATATGLNTWPRNSPVFVFPHLTFLKNTDTEGQALQGVTHMRAQDQSPQTQEAAGGWAGAAQTGTAEWWLGAGEAVTGW